MRVTLSNGAALPLWVDDYLAYQSIATTAYDPIATYQASSKTQSDVDTLWTAIKSGFAVKNVTENSGYIYAITWRQFEDYKKKHKTLTENTWDTSGIVPRQIHLLGGEWAVTPIVKVFKDNDGTYPSTVTTINVARIL